MPLLAALLELVTMSTSLLSQGVCHDFPRSRQHIPESLPKISSAPTLQHGRSQWVSNNFYILFIMGHTCRGARSLAMDVLISYDQVQSSLDSNSSHTREQPPRQHSVIRTSVSVGGLYDLPAQ